MEAGIERVAYTSLTIPHFHLYLSILFPFLCILNKQSNLATIPFHSFLTSVFSLPRDLCFLPLRKCRCVFVFSFTPPFSPGFFFCLPHATSFFYYYYYYFFLILDCFIVLFKCCYHFLFRSMFFLIVCNC